MEETIWMRFEQNGFEFSTIKPIFENCRLDLSDINAIRKISSYHIIDEFVKASLDSNLGSLCRFLNIAGDHYPNYAFKNVHVISCTLGEIRDGVKNSLAKKTVIKKITCNLDIIEKEIGGELPWSFFMQPSYAKVLREKVTHATYAVSDLKWAQRHLDEAREIVDQIPDVSLRILFEDIIAKRVKDWEAEIKSNQWWMEYVGLKTENIRKSAWFLKEIIKTLPEEVKYSYLIARR